MDIKSETIAHYLRMREWVLTQDLNNSVDNDDMSYGINEDWYGKYCKYCQIRGDGCDDCILSVWDCHEGAYGCLLSWYDMNGSGSWRGWLKEWYNVVYYICVFG